MDYNEIIKQINTTDSKFGSAVDAAQKAMLREVLTLTKDLELSNGKILPTVGNLKKIATIKEKLNKAVLSKDYIGGVKDLLKSFETIQEAQIGYFKSISENKPTQQKYDLVRGMAIENTAAQLTESGLDANVTNKLKDMLLRAVTSGVKYSDMVGEVGEFLTNTEKSAGALSKYAKTYTTTALNQFAGQTNKLMTEDADFEWYRYTGSDIETTREFCDLMTDKDYFHKSEIPELLKGHIDGKKCEIYEKTGLPKGMIEGTNKENFIVNAGGWQCRHQIVPVLTFTVPKNLRDKFNITKTLNTEKEIPKEEKSNIFVPAKDIESAKKATNDIFTKNGINPKKITYNDNLTLKQANIRNKTLDELLSTYKPQTAYTDDLEITFSSTAISYGSIWYNENGLVGKMNFGHKTDADRIKEGRVIEKDKFFKVYAEKSKVDKENLEISTLVHEYVHILTDDFGLNVNKNIMNDIKKIKTAYSKELNKAVRESKTDDLNEIFLGNYASSKTTEFAAEAFAEYKLKTNPSKYAKQVGELIDSYYKK